jgi:hypothetical protein
VAGSGSWGIAGKWPSSARRLAHFALLAESGGGGGDFSHPAGLSLVPCLSYPIILMPRRPEGASRPEQRGRSRRAILAVAAVRDAMCGIRRDRIPTARGEPLLATRRPRLDAESAAEAEIPVGDRAMVCRRRETSLTTPMKILEILSETAEPTYRFLCEGWD